MKLVLLCHPKVSGSTSMPRYARMIGEGMTKRGHAVTYWTAPAIFSSLAAKPGGLQKWLGYVDSYLIFPVMLRWKKRRVPADTLFVVTDHALGMWVPAIASRAHVIHCHDFLAQRSAMGKIAEHPTGVSGRTYQKLIRRGFQQGHNFISISQKTKEDLQHFLNGPPVVSEVVHNGLNYPFTPLPRMEALARLLPFSQFPWERGYFMHVGGNQWYKNRAGVIKLYQQYLTRVKVGIPLMMIGAPPDQEVEKIAEATPANGSVHFISGLDDTQVHAAYAAATALIFPSLEEGFGWPIIEAQAAGCPVITTQHAPMNEVGGSAAWYLPRRNRLDKNEDEAWAKNGAGMLEKIAALSETERGELAAAGIANASQFTTEATLNHFEEIYQTISANDRRREPRQ